MKSYLLVPAVIAFASASSGALGAHWVADHVTVKYTLAGTGDFQGQSLPQDQRSLQFSAYCRCGAYSSGLPSIPLVSSSIRRHTTTLLTSRIIRAILMLPILQQGWAPSGKTVWTRTRVARATSIFRAARHLQLLREKLTGLPGDIPMALPLPWRERTTQIILQVVHNRPRRSLPL